MGLSIGQSPVPEDCFRLDQLCFDACFCYNPHRTQFLRIAEETGASVLNGLGMLVHQGIAQMELWSGRTIPHEMVQREIAALREEMGH